MNNENRLGIEKMDNEQLEAYLKKGIDAHELGKAVMENDAREILENAYNGKSPKEYDIDRNEPMKITVYMNFENVYKNYTCRELGRMGIDYPRRLVLRKHSFQA